jgi:UDP-N-acetylglucosamine/UDP-N-acetylgalactosamine diphosphorylase
MLANNGQEHVLHFWDELNEKEQAAFVQQIESIDFNVLLHLASLNSSDSCGNAEQIAPSPLISVNDDSVDWEQVRSVGESVLQKGAIGVLTVAGGQGTRLGWSGPKGTFPATPITGKSLFQLIAEQILFASEKYQVTIPWYIMTSQENDAVTRSFLLDNNCFGLDRTTIFAFPQGVVPAVDQDGKMLLAKKNQIFMNPDGHGGVITAMKQSGALEEMVSRGIEHLSYVQVDNPLVKAIDPKFIGIHCSEQSSCEVTSKCVLKKEPEERVGVFCKKGTTTSIVEYSDLTEQQTHETTVDGNIAFCCGSIAAHLISTRFIERVAGDLPWHVAHKKIPHIDIETGEFCEPKEPNACKFERFVFDVLPLAENSLVLETLREEEFAPIKNASGTDSAQTSMELQIRRAIQWLQNRGVEVSESALVEISPTTASSAEDIPEEILPKRIDSGETMVL